MPWLVPSNSLPIHHSSSSLPSHSLLMNILRSSDTDLFLSGLVPSILLYKLVYSNTVLSSGMFSSTTY